MNDRLNDPWRDPRVAAANDQLRTERLAERDRQHAAARERVAEAIDALKPNAASLRLLKALLNTILTEHAVQIGHIMNLPRYLGGAIMVGINADLFQDALTLCGLEETPPDAGNLRRCADCVFAQPVPGRPTPGPVGRRSGLEPCRTCNSESRPRHMTLEQLHEVVGGG